METWSTTKTGTCTYATSRDSLNNCFLVHPLSWDPIVKYIKDQHSAYLRKELTAVRDRYIQDTRIHCCLFFINPTGHSLRPIDIIVMKKLSEVVNVVPVIAKADSLTMEERDVFKQRVKPLSCSSHLPNHSFNLYRFVLSLCTTTLFSIPSTRMRMTRRSSVSTRGSGFVVLPIKFHSDI